MDRITFAGSRIETAPFGVGTWAWGDADTWGMGTYDPAVNEATIAEAFEASIEAGITFFDTAEVYGNGESERIIGRLLGANPGVRDDLVIATKFMPMPQKLNVVGAVRKSLEASLGRLGVDQVELYQIHGPTSLRSPAALAEALARVHSDGLVRAVGVSNYSEREMTRIHRELDKRGMRLASNQIEFSLLRRQPETSGLLAACKRQGVIPIAYSPIGQGRLTGKYSAVNPPPKVRTFSAHPMEQVDRVVGQLRLIGDEHDGRTPAQVALRWIIQKGAVPIAGAKSAEQARQNAGALGWTLSDREMATLDGVALREHRSLRNRIWQHG